MSNNKYQFTPGDGCKASTKGEFLKLKKILKENGHKVYPSGYDVYFTHFYLSEDGIWMQCDPLCVTGEFKYDDLVSMIKGEPETLEQQITDYKNQDESISFIAVEDGRVLLKVDAQGFVTIGETVVGHEPGLPKHFPNTRKLVDHLTNSGFNPDLPFEVSDQEGKEWYKPDNSSYVGQDKNGCHLLLIECPSGFELDEYQSFPRIRNVKKPEFEEGQPIWYKGRTEHWNFGLYVKHSGDDWHTVSTQKDDTFLCNHIRPFFVDGVATYPPFL